jgi:hypothetical protein
MLLSHWQLYGLSLLTCSLLQVQVPYTTQHPPAEVLNSFHGQEVGKGFPVYIAVHVLKDGSFRIRKPNDPEQERL